MAKEKKPETRTSIDDLNDQLTSFEQKVQNNQKIILWAGLGIAAIVLIVLVYVYAIRQPGIKAANEAIGAADSELFAGNDSIAAVKYMEVADNYGYEAGNRAALSAAILLYQDKKYEEALNYLHKYDTKDNIIGASALSLEGDCYVNLENYDAALNAFDRAIKASKDNAMYTPFFMMKKATVLHHLKRYSEEAAVYQELIDKYPTYGEQNNIDIERYLERAKQLAAE